ncbi:alanine/glycine:cation symporter family protein [Bacteroidota bacterium]
MSELLEAIDRVILSYNEYVGGYLVLIALIPTGLFFTIKFKFLQITKLGHAFKIITGVYDRKEDEGEINHFKSLNTALSATIGTGNIVGVSLAIYFGGPGAMFWMWVTGILGMMIKLVECTLSLQFRNVNEDGSISGGPMYYMEKGLKKYGKISKIMAVIFAFATILCSFGTGNIAQSNSMSDVFFSNYGVPHWVTGIVISTLVLLVIVGGIKRIARISASLVPAMSILYFVSGLLIIILYFTEIPYAFALIFSGAFNGTAASGGFIGSAFILTIRYGVARGLFSNEAGQGSAPIAHSAAKTKFAAQEGLVASTGPFIDTLIICSLTAFVIILTGAWKSGIQGVSMTVEGFSIGLQKIGLEFLGQHIVAVGLLLFAFSTMISWSYYGDRATEYLFGRRYIITYRYVYGLFAFLGAIWGIDLVWHFVDMVITFMTIPNLIAILFLTPIAKKEIKKYLEHIKTIK